MKTQHNKIRILLVEDDTLIALVEKKALETLGYEVSHVLNGEEALEVCSQDFSLVLMDIVLGEGLDGYETAKIIMEQCKLPVVFLSSLPPKDIAAQIERISPWGFVPKSTEPYRLSVHIETVLRLHSAWRRHAQTEKLDTTLSSACSESFSAQTLEILCERLLSLRDCTDSSQREYLFKMAETTIKKHSQGKNINFTSYIDEFNMKTCQFLPLLICIQELLINTCRHAFTEGRAANVSLTLCSVKNTYWDIVVSDDGKGLTLDGMQKKEESCGLELISIMARSLDSKLEVNSGKGTSCRLRIRHL